MHKLCTLLTVLLLPAVAGADSTLATVDGAKITQEMLESYAIQRGAPNRQSISPDQADQLLKELIDRELLYKEAIGQGLDKTRQAVSEIESARRNILASIVIRNLNSAENKITDKVLIDAYNEYIKTLDNQEVKARHILVSTKEAAEGIIKELDKGADFAELAKEKSEGPSKSAGGDLGWFRPSEMVDAFAEALKGMKKGKYSSKPVQTQFGWHVILLEDTRKVDPPPFPSVKGQIAQKVQSERIEAYLKSLRDKAKISLKK